MAKLTSWSTSWLALLFYGVFIRRKELGKTSNPQTPNSKMLISKTEKEGKVFGGKAF
jgi:hypothetical protein